ncbi:GIY-YIG nuclease family protein [Natronorarus salvus]|uniref:GIY-YIG nuclease family protein n=1 Tax=Natronorarus salvus TaxID=3117733 RepID=UPI0039081AB7
MGGGGSTHTGARTGSFTDRRDEPAPVTGGTYTLLIALGERAEIEVGALGAHLLEPGWYAYTGSAFGPGGFSRVERHRELARGERVVRHWHVDALLCHEGSRIEGVVRSPDADVECTVARALPDAGIAGFGASDCSCRSHLAYDRSARALLRAASRAHWAAFSGSGNRALD